MKKTCLIIASLFALNLSSQNKTACDTPLVGYSTISHSICVPMTYVLNSPYTNSLHISGTGANSYTWNVNGVDVSYLNYLDYTPTAPVISTVIVTGVGNCGLTNTVSFVLKAIACDYTVTTLGIKEYAPDHQNAIYYDIQGNKISKRFNELIIEQIGDVRKKVFIVD